MFNVLEKELLQVRMKLEGFFLIRIQVVESFFCWFLFLVFFVLLFGGRELVVIDLVVKEGKFIDLVFEG